MPAGSRLAELAAPPVERWAKCAEERQRREAAAMGDCSFVPKTVRGPRGKIIHRTYGPCVLKASGGRPTVCEAERTDVKPAQVC